MSKIKNVLIVFATSCFASVSTASSIFYPDFGSTAGLSLQGAAARSGNVLRLTATSGTSAGSAWFGTQQPVVGGFSTTFQFRITQPGGITDDDGNNGGDGMAFVIQNSSGAALGGGGLSMGYDPIPNSLAVEFDTFRNGIIGDPNGNHIGVHTGGTAANSGWEDHSLGIVTSLPNMSDGNVHTAAIDYLPGTMTISLDGASVLSVPVNLATKLNLNGGSAWVGFTASIFAAVENHDILNWTLTVPEPSSMAILGTGGISLLAYTLLRRR